MPESFSQVSQYSRNIQNAKIITKIKEYEKNADIIDIINNCTKILDTISDDNIDLKLFMIDLSNKQHFRIKDSENYYRSIKKYSEIALKENNPYYLIKSKLLEAELFLELKEVDKSRNILIELEPLITDEIKKVDIILYAEYYILKHYIADLLGNKDEEHKFAAEIFNILSTIDKNDPNLNIIHVKLLIHYGDYQDQINKGLSFQFYCKANNLAIKNNLTYLINFSRIRIAGSLIIREQAENALDTLRLITKSNKDLNASYLHYQVYMNAFESLGMQDSVNVYKMLFDETEKIAIESAINYNNKLNLKEAVKKVDAEIDASNNKADFISKVLFISIILGFITVVFIFINRKNLF